MKCHHDASSQSTLRLLAVTNGKRAMFSCECTACKRMTEWFYTRYEAQVEAWYECWMKELA